ncbi:MAG TPA: ferrous iron transport protein B [Firmicutes bacterium]|nr:ferrous iron transport protein B [Candidatus Fermentithermobacillaceae bacterium]
MRYQGASPGNSGAIGRTGQSDVVLTIALVGQPNVGKSVVMNLLTGAGAVVSNYPGTTVEITEGIIQAPAGRIKVIDTPGTYSLHSETDEQKVTQKVLLEGKIDLIVNVVDARNLARNLYLTLQLLEFESPMVLVLNQMDMADEEGIEIDAEALSKALGIPVVPMIATKNQGTDQLLRLIHDVAFSRHRARDFIGKPASFSDRVELAISQVEETIKANIPGENGRHYSHPSRALAIHLLESDHLDEDILARYPEVSRLVESLREEVAPKTYCTNCLRGCTDCQLNGLLPQGTMICLERTHIAAAIAQAVTRRKPGFQNTNLRKRLEILLDRPSTGLPILAGIVYLSFRLVMVVMGASEELIPWLLNPIIRYITNLADSLPRGSLLEIVVRAVPESILVPLTVVMPAMISIYLVMAILEDSGLLPRIAVAADKLASALNLPGQAVIPFILGFGCRAPAVLATRILPDKRTRLLVSTLLSITVPCAASLGIVAGLATTFGASLPVMYVTLVVAFIAIGFIAGRIGVPGQLVLEVPPLRMPVVSNVTAKVSMRLEGFFKHVLPVLMCTGIGTTLLINVGAFTPLERLSPVSTALFGVRGQALAALAVTVVQRYMGPMVLLNIPLTAREATIAGSMVLLSVPCLPVSILLVKELGWKTLVGIYALAILMSLGTGVALNLILPL